MNHKLPSAQLLTVTFVVMLAIGCSSSSTEPDADALTLREMAGEALAVSGIDEPVLRQVWVNQVAINPFAGTHGFAITNEKATVGVNISAKTPDQPPNEWRRVSPEFIRYLADVSLDLELMNVGPAAAMGAMADHWPGCVPRGQTIVGTAEGNTQWILFCDLPEGTVSGWVDAETGEFTPSDAPPEIGPVTATPDA